MWVFQNISDLDHTGELVETWSATVEHAPLDKEGSAATVEKPIQDYVEEYLIKLGKETKPLNSLEVASEAAEEMLRDRHYATTKLYQDLPSGTYFTEEGQDLFNQYYEEALEYLERRKNERT